MALPLPDLDTRRWRDLVEEGRSLIPTRAGEWTDHNVHDPGITFIELMAWVIESSMYRANTVSDRHLAKFLGLAGFAPRPPSPARVVLAFESTAGPIHVLAGAQCATSGSEPVL